jgi:hypothetical protein
MCVSLVRWVSLSVSTPWLPRCRHVLREHLAPRDDGDDDHDPEDRRGLLADGPFKPTVQPQRQGDDAEPEQLPRSLTPIAVWESRRNVVAHEIADRNGAGPQIARTVSGRSARQDL